RAIAHCERFGPGRGVLGEQRVERLVAPQPRRVIAPRRGRVMKGEERVGHRWIGTGLSRGRDCVVAALLAMTTAFQSLRAKRSNLDAARLARRRLEPAPSAPAYQGEARCYRICCPRRNGSRPG